MSLVPPRVRCTALVIAISFAGQNSIRADDLYALTRISMPPLSPASFLRMNEAGALCGTVIAAGVTRAFLWDSVHGYRELALNGAYTNSSAMDVNNDGVVVGTHRVSSTMAADVLTRWDANGLPNLIAPPVGFIGAVGAGINDAGWICGVANNGPAFRSFVYVPFVENEYTILPQFPNAPRHEEQAFAMNNSGLVVGSGPGANGTWLPFAWSQSVGLIQLPGLVAGLGGQAISCNEIGTTVGYARIANSPQLWRATMWPNEDAVQDLGTLPAWDSSIATDVSSGGVVVGTIFNLVQNQDQQAFIWSASRGMRLLSDEIAGGVGDATLLSAWDITSDGRFICGAERDSAGVVRAFRLERVASPCVGDIDHDTVVGLSDLAILLSNFGTPAGASLGDGDITDDGAVELSDLAILLSTFGTSC